MKIVFFGTPDFACPALEKLAKKDLVSLVVTQPDSKKGRGRKLHPSAVAELGERLGLPLYKPKTLRDREVQDRLAKEEADLYVVVAYGQILPKEVLDQPTYGCINIHGSLLPKYRGAAPIERAILEGEEETGISLMEMEEGLDSGPVYMQKSMAIGEKSASQLRQDLSILGADLLLNLLPQIGKVEPKSQDQEKATYADKISKGDGLLKLGEDSSFEMLRKIQAMDGYKGAYFTYNGQNYKVFKARDHNQKMQEPIVETDGQVYLATRDGSIEVDSIQAPGKKKMATKDYLRGNSILKG